MATVFIPPLMRTLTGGVDRAEISGETVRQIITALDSHFPGLRERLCNGDSLRPGLSVAIDGVVSSRGLLTKVPTQSEVHFLPAVGGG